MLNLMQAWPPNLSRKLCFGGVYLRSHSWFLDRLGLVHGGLESLAIFVGISVSNQLRELE